MLKSIKSLQKSHLPKLFLLAIPFFLALFSLRKVLIKPGYFYYGEGGGSTNYGALFKNLWYSWHDYTLLGNTNIGFPNTLHHLNTGVIGGIFGLHFFGPLWILQSLLGVHAQKIFLIGVILLTFFGMYALAKFVANRFFNLKQVEYFSILAATFYLINGFFIGWLKNAFGTFILSYAIFPLLLLAFYRSREDFGNRHLSFPTLLGGGIVLALLTQYGPHFVIIFLLFASLDVLLECLFEGGFSYLKKSLIILAILGGISAVFNIHIFLPALLFPEKGNGQIIGPYFSLGDLRQNSQFNHLATVFRLYTTPVNFLINYFFLIASLFSIFWLKKKKVGVFLLVLIIGALLAKGSNPPLKEFSEWFFLKLPILHAFRNPGLFAILVAVSYSLLIPLVVILFGNFIQKFPLNKLFLVLFLTIVVISNLGFFSGDFGKVIVPINPPSSYERLNLWLKSQQGIFRTLYLPEGFFTDHTWSQSIKLPSPPKSVLEFSPLRTSLANQRFRNETDTLSSRFIGFVRNQVGIGSFTSELLNKINTKYLVVDDTFRPNTVSSKEAIEFRKRIEESESFNQADLDLENLYVYKNDLAEGPFSFSSNVIPVLSNNFKIYESLARLSSEVLRQPFAFIHQFPKDGWNKLSQDPLNLLFYNTSKTDFIAQQLNFDFSLPLAEHLKEEATDGRLDWLLAEPNLGDLVTKEGLIFQSGESIGTLGGAKLEISFKIRKEGVYTIFIRPLFHPGQGLLKINIDNEEMKEIDLNRNQYTGLNWIEIATMKFSKGEHRLILENSRLAQVIIDGLIVAPEERVRQAEERIDRFLPKGKLMFLYSLPYINEMLIGEEELKVGKTNYQISTEFYYFDDFDTVKREKDTLSISPFSAVDHGYPQGIVLGTPGEGTGTYDIIYKMETSSSVQEMRMVFNVGFLATDRVARLFVSQDGEKWQQIGQDLVTDDHPEEFDISDFVKGKRSVYLKYQVEDNSPGFGSLITRVGFRGKLAKLKIKLDVPPGEYSVFSDGRFLNAGELGGNSWLQLKDEPLSNSYLVLIPGKVSKLDFSEFFDLDKAEAIVNYNKISPARYHLRFNLEEPGVLVFRESYSPYWILGKKPPDFITDYYANGYYLAKGDYNVTLYHKPDRLYRFLLVFQLSLFTISLGYLSVSWVRKK